MFHSSLDSQVIQGFSAELQISDTMSESSDNATLLSLSREDLSQIGAGPIREDVRVSRKKLETLILREREDLTGKGFIDCLMENTNTFIQWPSRMKIGAKTKKDLFVRVYGHDDEGVSEAKAHILQELGPQRDLKITLKLEISYTDHSHLIGCRGATIREVMDNTGCHIHFPDSNRMSKDHKSNQVTIAGALIDAVEKARSRVRELSPLIFQFNLPVIQARFDVHLNPDANNIFIDNIQSAYNVMVTVHPPNKLQQTTIAVKGCEVDHIQVKEAVGRIINYFASDSPANGILIESTMEITAVQHSFVRSVNDSNIHSIMMSTGAKIVFPDLSDTNIQQIKRSRIYITGDLNSVFLARQQLIGCLPLRMIFDLSDQFPLEWESVRQICADLNVNVKMINRNRPGGGSGTPGSSLPPPIPGRSRTIQLIAAERNAGNLIESRRRILGGVEPVTNARIPPTYLLRHAPPPGLVPFAGGGATLTPMMLNSPNMLSPILSPSFWPPTPFSTPFCSPQLVLQSGHHEPPLMGGGAGTPVPGLRARHYQGLLHHKYGRDYSRMDGGRSPNDIHTPTFHGGPIAPVNLLPRFDFQQNRRAPGFERSSTNPNIVVSPPEAGGGMDGRANSVNDKKYLAMKAMYQSKISNRPRTPTSQWAGYGFSKTFTNLFPTQESSNGQNIATELSDDGLPSEESGTTASNIWTSSSTSPSPSDAAQYDTNNNVLVCEKGDGTELDLGPSEKSVKKTPLGKQQSNLFDFGNILDVSSAVDLPSLFITHGLDKYIDNFISEEIDLSSFSTLSEADLRTLGVSSYPARKKMLLLINQIRYE